MKSRLSSGDKSKGRAKHVFAAWNDGQLESRYAPARKYLRVETHNVFQRAESADSMCGNHAACHAECDGSNQRQANQAKRLNGPSGIEVALHAEETTIFRVLRF